MRSSLAAFQKKAMAVVGHMQKSTLHTTTAVHEFFDKAEKQLAKLAGGGRIHGTTQKMHGIKERTRRIRQMKGPNPNITPDQLMSTHLAHKLITD